MAEERILRLTGQQADHGVKNVEWEELELAPPYDWERSVREEHYYYKHSGNEQVGAAQIVYVLEKIFPFLLKD